MFGDFGRFIRLSMSEKIMRDILQELTDELSVRTGYSRSTISHKIHGRASFLDDFFGGTVRSPHIGKSTSTLISHYFVMLDKIRAMWPADAPWPNGKKMQGNLGKMVQEFMRAPPEGRQPQKIIASKAAKNIPGKKRCRKPKSVGGVPQ